MLVRRGSAADLDALAPLFDAYRQFYRKASDLAGARKFLTERLERAESIIFVAAEGDALLGFTQLYPSFSSGAMRRIFVLNDLFVAPSARCGGVGAALLDAAGEYGREQGAARLVLSTAVTNSTAQRLYERAGWVRDTSFLVYERSL